MHKIAQAAAINACVALEALQRANLVVQLVENLTSYVTARQNGENLEKCGNGRSCGPVVVALAVLEHWVVQKLKSQEGPHSLRKRLFIMGYARSGLSGDFSCGFNHPAILPLQALSGKCATVCCTVASRRARMRHDH